MKKFAMIVVVVFLAVWPTIGWTAGWTYEGLAGLDITFYSGGTTELAVNHTEDDDLWMKTAAGWNDTGIRNVQNIFFDADGRNFIGTADSLFSERNKVISSIYNGGVIGGARRGSTIYIVTSDHALKKSADGFTWTTVATEDISPSCIALKSGADRLHLGGPDGIYSEIEVGSETFELMPIIISEPRKIVYLGTDLYVLETDDQISRIYFDGAYQSAPMGWAYDITSDSQFVYLYAYDGLIYRTADGESPIALPDLVEQKNKIVARDQKLMATTSNGAYSLNFGLATPATVTIANVGGNLNLTWTAVDGAVAYKIYYGASFSALSSVNLGNVLSTSIPSAGINVIIVAGVSVDGYESVVRHWFVANGDTTPPPAITNLVVTQVSDTEAYATWTNPADPQSQVVEYDLRYRLLSAGKITALNFAASPQAAGEPLPGASGTSAGMLITGLTPGVTYSFALKSKNQNNKWSAISNVVTVTTLAAGQRALKLAWDANPESDNVSEYRMYRGLSAGDYGLDKIMAVSGLPDPQNPTAEYVLNGGQQYIFAVSAANQFGESRLSDPLTVFLP